MSEIHQQSSAVFLKHTFLEQSVMVPVKNTPMGGIGVEDINVNITLKRSGCMWITSIYLSIHV